MITFPYLESLNSKQRDAVIHTEGPLLVLAGAGSGKTRVITHRIVHIIHHGTAPYNILAVTFTNKAAKEMRERVEALIKKYPPSERAAIDSLPVVTTFHALGVRILREFHEQLGLPRHFTIYDRADTLRAVKSAVEKAGYSPKEFEPKKILSKISRAKGDAITAPEYKLSASSFPDQVAANVWEHYETILHAEHALDFDDLLIRTLGLLKNNPVVRETLQKRFKYIHVDEYQDTNAVQFEREFPGAQTILLEENYRSTKTIIAASNEIIEKNKNRVAKEVFTSNEEGEKITLYAAMTGQDEAEYIALTAKSLIEGGAHPTDIAVLY